MAKIQRLIASFRKLAGDQNGIVPSASTSRTQPLRPSDQKVLQAQSRGILPAMLQPFGVSRQGSTLGTSMPALALTIPEDDDSIWEPKLLAGLKRVVCQLW